MDHMPDFERHWIDSLESTRQAGLWRERKVLESPQGVEVRIDGQGMVSFCSNDYLGLANHPEITRAAHLAIDKYGVGSGASHLVSGHHAEHESLERELAAFLGYERALTFSSGYMANMAVLTALSSKGSVILQDKLNHASLIDGGRSSDARSQRYLHNDPSSLEKYLKRFQYDEPPLVVTDGVFSMDGDTALLPEISSITKRAGGILVVDDAHGVGVMGESGKGSVNAAGLSSHDVPVLIGTFGKAFGTAGAFVAGSENVIEYLIQTARPYIYTTAQPPLIAAATRESLRLIRGGGELRQHLNRLIGTLRAGVEDLGLSLLESSSAIQPLIIGNTNTLISTAKFLKDKGFLVGAIRPPTVPRHTDRLRITLSAAHHIEHIHDLLTALEAAKRKGILVPS